MTGVAETDVVADALVVTCARLNRLHGRVLTKLPVPLTFRQHRTLIRVAAGHTSLTELAALSNLTLPSVSETVDGLVRKGLLTRAEHPQDRRVYLLALTPAGTTASAEAQAELMRVTTGLLDDVPETDRAALHRALDALYAAATKKFKER